MKMIGKIMMVLPIQASASHRAIYDGYDVGSIAWWAYVLITGGLFILGYELAKGKIK